MATTPRVRALRAEEAAHAAELAAATGVPFGDAAAWSADATTSALVSEVDGALVGVALGRVVAGEGEVLVVAVAEQARRLGAGRALTSTLLRTLSTRGAERVVLEVRASNAPAIAMYRAAGLTEVGRRPRYYADGEDALLLADGPPPA